MTSTFPFAPAVWSHAIALCAFIALSAQVIVGWRTGRQNIALLVAAVVSAAWASAVIVALLERSPSYWWLAGALDTLRTGTWIIFLAVLLESTRGEESLDVSAVRIFRSAIVPLIFLLVTLLLPQPPPWHTRDTRESFFVFVAPLGAAVFALAMAEQLFRRTPNSRRWAIKPLVLGLGAMFALDILLHSSGILFHHIDPDMWAARGVALAIVVVLISVATARNFAWTLDLHISREAVYNSTAVLIAGVYLLLAAIGGYWVRIFGGDWGASLSVAFTFAAVLALATLLLSGSVRAHLRVFISKNLFSHRYDYRGEWLRFTRSLGTAEPGENLFQQVVRALADLVESTGGAIWLKQDGVFVEIASISDARVGEIERPTSELISFLAKTGWVIRIDEFLELPANYPGLALPDWLRKLPNAWLVVPLSNGTNLIGFVILSTPRTQIDVNWEVRDLLKTASRQAASFISQVLASEALVESEKFDAFNRMSAFVVHDLKNVVAQLGLMLKNAERHLDNPDFRNDMLATVGHAVERMNQLMLQLRSGTTPVEKPHAIDLAIVLARIVAGKQLADVSIEFTPLADVRVLAHSERIERVIGHIVQNAIEASSTSSVAVTIRMNTQQNDAVIHVIDHGVGMSEEFMQERLFHPFQTTKAQGMGIGMFESRRYVDGIGGRILVESSLECGTHVQVILPLADDTIGANAAVGQSA